MALTNDDLQAVGAMMQNIIEPLQNNITDIKLHLENVTDRNISIIAENHIELNKKLNKALENSSVIDLYKIKLNTLSDEVEKLKKEVDELKSKIA